MITAATAADIANKTGKGKSQSRVLKLLLTYFLQYVLPSVKYRF